MTTATTADPAEGTATNQVILRGRVAAAPTERTLPSGDLMLTLRVIVDRPQPSGRTRSRQRVDTLDCVVWNGRVQRGVRAWRAGDQVQVEGAIRRRFFRGASGPVSRVEVEVSRARRISAAAG